MNLNPDDDPRATYDRCAAELRIVHEAAWSHPEGSRPGLRLPVDLGHYRGVPRDFDISRRFGVVSTRRVYHFADGTQRGEAGDHELTRLLATRVELMETVEGVVVEVSDRVRHWFGTRPSHFDWMVTPVGEPRVTNLGYWLDTAGWSTDIALEDAREDGLDTPQLEEAEGIPEIWSRMIRYAIQWEIAARWGLEIPRTYRPPSAIVETPFSELPNPFWPILDIWRCGVAIDVSFVETDPAVLYVDVASLLGGVE